MKTKMLLVRQMLMRNKHDWYVVYTFWMQMTQDITISRKLFALAALGKA